MAICQVCKGNGFVWRWETSLVDGDPEPMAYECEECGGSGEDGND